jgi:hypothetical protein
MANKYLERCSTLLLSGNTDSDHEKPFYIHQMIREKQLQGLSRI